MTDKQPPEQSKLFPPNYKAYIFVVLFTGVTAGIYWVGMRAINNMGNATVLGGVRSTYLVVELIICGLAWFYVIEHLLRHYEADDLGLTVYRIRRPTLR